MRVFEKLKPEDVFYYFEEICRIPHGSGNVKELGDYLVNFAKEKSLEHYQDEAGNVIIIKEASEGYEDHEPVMLQGHMDMVTVKKPDCTIDMKREGLRLRAEGDKVYAEGTSLGGDDGIAVAYGLALLAGEGYRHPRLELVLTVDEETGMDGARAIDLAPCRAHMLINLDSEEEGYFWVGCAGGVRVNYGLSYKERKRRGIPCAIKISGLMGGHSGAEIHKGRGNANCLLGRALAELSGKTAYAIESLKGGLADNAIPREAVANLVLTGEESSAVRAAKETVLRLQAELAAELADKDPNVKVEVCFAESAERSCMDEKDSRRVAALLNSIPDGVQSMSGAVEGLVETSLNLGILSCKEGELHGGISVRSSLESAKNALVSKLGSIGALAGASLTITGDYPGWAYRKDSPLRDKMTEVYERMYHRKPEIRAIHAGLECGLFSGKIENLDCVSIGPDMKNIHTTEEELSVSSTERVWNFLINLLEEL